MSPLSPRRPTPGAGTPRRVRATPSAPDDELDHIDHALVERLRADGRESNRSLAHALGINEVTVASRIRKMEGNSVMRVVAVTDMRIFGHREFAYAMLRVSGRPLLDVGAEIARLPEVVAVTVATGRYDLIVPLLGRDRRHLAELFGVILPGLVGIAEVNGHLALDVLKFDTNWALLAADPGSAPDAQPSDTVDELDIAIIKLLQVDARRSNRRIATELDVSEGTVRGRIKRLVADRVIQVQAVCDTVAFGIGAHAFVGIKTRDGLTDEVGKQLVACANVAELTRTLGEYDFIAVVIADTHDLLFEALLHEITVIPGIRWTETFETCAAAKHAYAWSWLV